jgi:hypothetical protein
VEHHCELCIFPALGGASIVPIRIGPSLIRRATTDSGVTEENYLVGFGFTEVRIAEFGEAAWLRRKLLFQKMYTAYEARRAVMK